MKTICYEVQNRHEDTGMWAVIRTVPVDVPAPDGKTYDFIGARVNAVAQARGVLAQFSDLRVVRVCIIDRDPNRTYLSPQKHYRFPVWVNGVWRDNHMILTVTN